MAKRFFRTFLAFCFFGAVGVLADVDHLVCLDAALHSGDIRKLIQPGCDALHPFYLVGGFLAVGALGALCLGCLVGLVQDAARPAVGRIE